MKKLTVSNYRKDKYYPAVSHGVAEVLNANGVVAPVEVLLRLRCIGRKQYEDWRFGRIPEVSV